MVIEALFQEKQPDQLFHYTSHDGLIGMAKTKELWASKSTFMNDALEFRLALDLARAEIERQPFAEQVRDQLLYDIDDIEQVNIFVASFSENCDDLSQWRGYCSPGPGYSIGFRTTDLVRAAGVSFYLVKCTYDSDIHQKAVAEIVSHGANRVSQRDHAEPGFSARGIERDPLWSMDFSELLAFVAPLLKHAKFHGEEEWRLVSQPIPYTSPGFDHRSGRSMIIPYYRFALATEGLPAPLARVVIGPTPHPSLAKDAVSSLLRSAGVKNCTVEHSKIPFRNW